MEVAYKQANLQQL